MALQCNNNKKWYFMFYLPNGINKLLTNGKTVKTVDRSEKVVVRM